jgi:hypothetical protein
MPGLSATVAHLGRSLARIRWDQLVSSPVVVSNHGSGLFVPNYRRGWLVRCQPSELGALAVGLAGGCGGTLLYFRAVLCAA